MVGNMFNTKLSSVSHVDLFPVNVLILNTLTHFSPMPYFYSPRKRQKAIGFLTFSGGIEMRHWTKMG